MYMYIHVCAPGLTGCSDVFVAILLVLLYRKITVSLHCIHMYTVCTLHYVHVYYTVYIVHVQQYPQCILRRVHTCTCTITHYHVQYPHLHSLPAVIQPYGRSRGRWRTTLIITVVPAEIHQLIFLLLLHLPLHSGGLRLLLSTAPMLLSHKTLEAEGSVSTEEVKLFIACGRGGRRSG